MRRFGYLFQELRQNQCHLGRVLTHASCSTQQYKLANALLCMVGCSYIRSTFLLWRTNKRDRTRTHLYLCAKLFTSPVGIVYCLHACITVEAALAEQGRMHGVQQCEAGHPTGESRARKSPRPAEAITTHVRRSLMKSFKREPHQQLRLKLPWFLFAFIIYFLTSARRIAAHE